MYTVKMWFSPLIFRVLFIYFLFFENKIKLSTASVGHEHLPSSSDFGDAAVVTASSSIRICVISQRYMINNNNCNTPMNSVHESLTILRVWPAIRTYQTSFWKYYHCHIITRVIILLCSRNVILLLLHVVKSANKRTRVNLPERVLSIAYLFFVLLIFLTMTVLFVFYVVLAAST